MESFQGDHSSQNRFCILSFFGWRKAEPRWAVGTLDGRLTHLVFQGERPGLDCRRFQKSRAHRVLAGRSTIAILLAVLASGCFSNGTRSSPTSSATPNPNTDKNKLTIPSGNNQIQVSGSPVPSTVEAKTLEIYGSIDQQLGSLCKAPPPTLFSTPPSPCQCIFNFKAVSGNTLVPDTQSLPVSYVEDNMVRCSYADLPDSAQNLSLQLSSGTLLSLPMPLELSALTGTSATEPSSFVEVRRYQCRELVTVYSLFGNNVYDPLQSESPFMSYPRNFYGTNFGNVHLALASQLASNHWDCVTDPAATSVDWTDFRLFSRYAGQNGPLLNGTMISDAQGSPSSKQTFYLAKKPFGNFSTPVHSLLAPGVPTSDSNDSIFPPLGYGAPIDQDGRCPASIAIDGTGTEIRALPTGWRWMKLWSMVAQFNQRNYVSVVSGGRPGPTLANRDINMVSCDTSGDITTIKDTAMRSRLVNSPDQHMSCFDFRPGLGINGAIGPDAWLHASTLYPEGKRIKCENASFKPLANGSSAASYPATDLAPSAVGTSGNYLLNYDPNTPAPDILFVLTPESINGKMITLNDFYAASTSPTAELGPYLPYRFLRKGECPSGDANCSSKINYGYLSPSDLPNPFKKMAFPICVPQPGGLP